MNFLSGNYKEPTVVMKDSEILDSIMHSFRLLVVRGLHWFWQHILLGF